MNCNKRCGLVGCVSRFTSPMELDRHIIWIKNGIVRAKQNTTTQIDQICQENAENKILLNTNESNRLTYCAIRTRNDNIHASGENSSSLRFDMSDGILTSLSPNYDLLPNIDSLMTKTTTDPLIKIEPSDTSLKNTLDLQFTKIKPDLSLIKTDSTDLSLIMVGRSNSPLIKTEPTYLSLIKTDTLDLPMIKTEPLDVSLIETDTSNLPMIKIEPLDVSMVETGTSNSLSTHSDSSSQTPTYFLRSVPKILKLKKKVQQVHGHINMLEKMAKKKQKDLDVQDYKSFLNYCELCLPPDVMVVIKHYLMCKENHNGSFNYSKEINDIASIIYCLSPKAYKVIKAELSLPPINT